MFALLGAPELRHVSTWEKASEAERTVQRKAWGLADDRVIYQLMKIADRIAADGRCRHQRTSGLRHVADGPATTGPACFVGRSIVDASGLQPNETVK